MLQPGECLPPGPPALVVALDLSVLTVMMGWTMKTPLRGRSGHPPERAWVPDHKRGRRHRIGASGVSVVIPCRSVSALAQGLLDTLRADPVCHEVIVVINGSPRLSEDVLGPLVRVLWLAQAGLSAAKNFGLNETHSEIVAFLDDDTVPDKAWCAELAAAFARHPAATVIGGPIRLAPEIEALGLGPEGRGYLAELDLGIDEIRCQTFRYPYGGNSAVRGNAARAAGGFAEAFGYAGGRLLPNEEIDLFRRMEAAGGEVWYTPSAGVTHCVAVNRASLPCLLRRAFWQGIGDRRTARRHPDLALPRPWRSALLAARWGAAAAFRSLVGQRSVASDHALRSVRALGSIVGTVWSE